MFLNSSAAEELVTWRLQIHILWLGDKTANLHGNNGMSYLLCGSHH